MKTKLFIMDSFLSLGGGSDEIAFYKQIIEDAMQKSEQMPYAERRAYEMNTNGDDDEYTIEGKPLRLLNVNRGSLSRDGRDQFEGKGAQSASASHQPPLRTLK